MNTAEAIIKIFEEENVSCIFGHPGEQIVPLYDALSNSSIEHILTRHEQGAVHAADGYARTSGKFGVCIASGGPGALNLVMGTATAFKDSVPMLVITGDNPKNSKGKHTFQDINIMDIFKPMTIKSFDPSNPKLAIRNIKEALEILKNEPHGPIHINISRDILLDGNIGDILDKKVPYSTGYNYDELDKAIIDLKNCKKPLIIAGAGLIWGDAIADIKKFSETNKIPIATTFHAKTILDRNDKFNLGLVGIRGTKMANYAFNTADLILILGSRLSERTTAIDEVLPDYVQYPANYKDHRTRSININVDKSALTANIKIHGDVKTILERFNSLNKITNSLNGNWLDEIHEFHEKIVIEGVDSEEIPLKPQVAIDTILKHSNNKIVVNDAGSHTTWVNLLSEVYDLDKLVFSGGMGPMGYGIPAACGVSIARPDENIILIDGDGGFQMSIQELATIKSNNLPILIFVLNNSQLGLIRQVENSYYDGLRYEVDLENPDFVSLVNAYGIEGEQVNSKDNLELAIKKGLKLNRPYFVEVIVGEEDIPIVPPKKTRIN